MRSKPEIHVGAVQTRHTKNASRRRLRNRRITHRERYPKGSARREQKEKARADLIEAVAKEREVANERGEL